MNRRGLALAAMLGGMAACFGIEEPPGGIASISSVLLPSPSVVRGDTMRDSTGVAVPLRAYAFARNGDTLKSVTATFFALNKRLHVENGFVIGDTAGTDTVGVVGALGPVQTPPKGVIVTVPPTTITPGALRDTIELDPLATDSLGISDALSVTLKGPGDTASIGFIVTYALGHGPPARDTAPAALVLNGRTRSLRDTTDATGQASRNAAVNRKAVTDAWLAAAVGASSGTVLDSIVVQATVQTRGYILSGNTLTYVVLLRRK